MTTGLVFGHIPMLL